MFCFHVSKAGDIDAVGAITKGHFVFVAGHFAASAAAHVVIHQIVAEFAAGVSKAVGKFRCGGIEKNASGFQRRTANEKDAALEFKRVLGLRIDDPHTANAARLRIEVEAVNDAVWADGEAASFLRGG